MKKCEVCGAIKAEEEFSKSYKNRCKPCVSAMAKAKRDLPKNAARIKEFYEEPGGIGGSLLIDWEQRRFELAKSCLQARLSTSLIFDVEELVRNCIKMADEMVKQLQEHETRNCSRD
jgi:hypothetical protein